MEAWQEIPTALLEQYSDVALAVFFRVAGRQHVAVYRPIDYLKATDVMLGPHAPSGASDRLRRWIARIATLLDGEPMTEARALMLDPWILIGLAGALEKSYRRWVDRAVRIGHEQGEKPA